MALKRITDEKGEVYFVDAKTGERVEVDKRYTDTKNKQSSVKGRFSTLLGVGQFVSIIGWLLVIGGSIAFVAGLSADRAPVALTIVGGVVGVAFGLLIVAIGQSVSCFVSIENNTYETNKAIQNFIEKFDKQS